MFGTRKVTTFPLVSFRNGEMFLFIHSFLCVLYRLPQIVLEEIHEYQQKKKKKELVEENGLSEEGEMTVVKVVIVRFFKSSLLCAMTMIMMVMYGSSCALLYICHFCVLICV